MPRGRRAVRLRVTEREDRAGPVHEPVALARTRCRDARHRRGGVPPRERAVRLRVTEREHAARRGDEPVALARRRGGEADDRCLQPAVREPAVRLRVAEAVHPAARGREPHSHVRRRRRAGDDRARHVGRAAELRSEPERVHRARRAGEPVAELAAGERRRRTRVEQRQRGVRMAEHGRVVGLQPGAQHRRVHLSEVDRGNEVAVVVEAREARLRAVQPALHVVADDDDRRGGAVVGAHVAVLLRPAAELGERHQHDLALPAGCQRGEERVDRGVEPRQQGAVPVGLVGVRVEPVDLGVDHSDAEVGVDEVRGEHELRRQVVGLVGKVVRRRDPLREEHELHLGRVVEVAERTESRRAVAPGDERVVHAGVGRIRPVDAERVVDAERQRRRLRRRADELRSDSAVQADAVERLVRSVRQAVEEAPEPAGRGRARAAPSVIPDVARGEVAEVGRLVADTAHDRDLALVEAGLEVGQRRVQREPAADRVTARDLQIGAERRVRGVGDRRDRIEAVVAAAQVDGHEDALVVGHRRRREGFEPPKVRRNRGRSERHRAALQEAPARHRLEVEHTPARQGSSPGST